MNGVRKIAKVTAIALPFIALGICLWHLSKKEVPLWDSNDAESDISSLEAKFDEFMVQFNGDLPKAKLAFSVHCRSLREAYIQTHSYHPLLGDWVKRFDNEVKNVNRLNKHRK